MYLILVIDFFMRYNEGTLRYAEEQAWIKSE